MQNLLCATRDIPYKSFTFVSTSSVLLPVETFYSATKAGAERLCQAYKDQYRKPISIVRPYSIYGIGEAPFRFIPTVFRSCMTGEPMTLDPEPVHDWVYVTDFVKRLLTAPTGISEVGTGIGTSNSIVVKLIEQITGKKANITHTKRMREFDNRIWVAKNESQSFVKLEEGLQKYYEYQTAQKKDI